MCCHAGSIIKPITKRPAIHVLVQATQPRGLEVEN